MPTVEVPTALRSDLLLPVIMESVSDELLSYNVIEAVSVEEATVIVVGEHHESKASASLVENLLDDISPTGICIEASPTQWSALDGNAPSRGGKVAQDIAMESSIPLYLIDQKQEAVVNALAVNEDIGVGADTEPPAPQTNGDIDKTALQTYRKTVREQQSERYQVLWEQRERVMRNRIYELAHAHDILVCVVGASHVQGIVGQLPDSERLSVEDARVVQYD